MNGMTIEDPAVRNGTRRMLQLRKDLIAAGEVAVGWKLGFGAPAWLERFGIPGPMVGFLIDSRRHSSGSTVDIEGWAAPVAEPEIAVHLGADIDDPAQAVVSISSIAAAIELADVDPPPDDLEEVVAGNIYHRAVILSDPIAKTGASALAGLFGRVSRDGNEVATTSDVEAMTGAVGQILSHSARLLGVFGEGFRVGDVVILGSVVPPLQIRPGETIGFAPEPLPEVSVSLD
jgi:2-keto-4-pentenoate hydratase